MASARCRRRRKPRDDDGLDRPRQPGPGAPPTIGDRLGARLVGSNGGWLASFGLGAIFAIGWTPCIGIILGGILTMAATSGTVAQGTMLLVAYCIGLGLPFVVDRARLRPRAGAASGRSCATAAPSR